MFLKLTIFSFWGSGFCYVGLTQSKLNRRSSVTQLQTRSAMDVWKIHIPEKSVEIEVYCNYWAYSYVLSILPTQYIHEEEDGFTTSPIVTTETDNHKYTTDGGANLQLSTTAYNWLYNNIQLHKTALLCNFVNRRWTELYHNWLYKVIYRYRTYSITEVVKMASYWIH